MMRTISGVETNLLLSLPCVKLHVRSENLTCLSVKSNEAAISIRLGRHRYLLKWNSFSSSSNCVFVYAVLNRLGRPFSVKIKSVNTLFAFKIEICKKVSSLRSTTANSMSFDPLGIQFIQFYRPNSVSSDHLRKEDKTDSEKFIFFNIDF